jgi:hypothetical protein
MASSQMEFYRRGNKGKIEINWHGYENGGEEIFHQAYDALRSIDTALIVVQSEPNTSATCFRMILQIIREASSLGVETRVVLPDKLLLDAAEVTGFCNFYQVFLTEVAALDDLNITDFYPLTLMPIGNPKPGPIAA